MYVARYTKKVSSTNKTKRVQYGKDHKDWPIYRGWDLVYFTDEAHVNPTERFQKPRVLRERGNTGLGGGRNNPANIAEEEDISSGFSVHCYACINWFFKSDLGFYNDEREMLPKPKPPRKPTKSKYETQETFNNQLREWEAKLPPPVTQEAQGNYMTQKYYAKNVLATYIKAINQARL
ncbi:hypothetical protein CC80DRAFT_560471 [Byssothecium circinans]|uniref:Uncharacterized protein n=1 Tax=Byssothecium circinans TaxID=147558 RepID=A0A6A5TZ20_9PLEO|nr:hypothetical protein CC80DRAFT_560471 [Byssothecium circinans]